VRGIILSALCLVMPAIALYNMILSPLNAQVFTRQIQIAATSPLMDNLLILPLLW
jgi:hypothetical protein